MTPLDRMKEYARAENAAMHRNGHVPGLSKRSGATGGRKVDRRRVIQMTLDGVSVQEIARTFGTTDASITWHIRNARRSGDLPEQG